MRLEILDHGYVELVESWGSDERIIEAARMSTDKGFTGWGPIACDACSGSGLVKVKLAPKWLGIPLNESQSERYHESPCVRCNGIGQVLGDEKLLRYLWENKHATPFEMAGLIVEVQAPIFVFREWHRHRTQSYNELSARYTALPDVNYVPSVERLLIGSDGSNRQAGRVSGAPSLDWTGAEWFVKELEALQARAQSLYAKALEAGVPKELARLPVPVSRYSRMRASANLRNWLAFLTLRQAPNAQWEIRQYADAVAKIVAQCFPRTAALFSENRA